MKQTILVETDEKGMLHIFCLIREGKLSCLKIDQRLELDCGYAVYFKRLNFNHISISELQYLDASLILLGSKFKFEFINLS